MSDQNKNNIEERERSSELPERLERKPAVLTPAPAFDMESLRLGTNYTKLAATTREQSSIPTDKPGPHDFFRVHTHNMMDVSLLENKVDGLRYLVSPSVADMLDSSLAKPKTLYLWMNRAGTFGLWPCGLQLDDGTDYPAWQSAHAVCQTAMERWLRIAWNKSANGYDMIFLSDSVRVPEPAWPTASFHDILGKAFKGRIITELDHPVLRRLRGEV